MRQTPKPDGNSHHLRYFLLKSVNFLRAGDQAHQPGSLPVPGWPAERGGWPKCLVWPGETWLIVFTRNGWYDGSPEMTQVTYHLHNHSACTSWMLKLEIWPQRSRYFAADIVALRGGWRIMGVAHFMGVAYPWGIDFGPFLVDGQLGCGIHGGGGKPKVSLLAKPLEIQKVRLGQNRQLSFLFDLRPAKTAEDFLDYSSDMNWKASMFHSQTYCMCGMRLSFAAF